MGEPGPESRTLALILFMVNDFLDKRRDFRLQQLPSTIARTVINDDDFDPADIGGADAIHNSSNGM
jgi:hypothetical protein